LSAILMFVAWNMGEWSAFARLRQFRTPYRVTLLAVFFLTVVFDLTVAVEVGLFAACATFIYRISSLTRSEPVSAAAYPALAGLDGEVAAHRLYGALFFGAVKLVEAMEHAMPKRALVLDLKNLIYMDSSGVDALRDLVSACNRQGVRLILCGLSHQPRDIAQRSGLLVALPASDYPPDLASGVALACQ
jgi:sulfate permease, SulP family